MLGVRPSVWNVFFTTILTEDAKGYRKGNTMNMRKSVYAMDMEDAMECVKKEFPEARFISIQHGGEVDIVSESAWEAGKGKTL